MNNVTFKVEGMHCSGCASTIQALLERKEGVRGVSASFDAGEAKVLFDPGSVSEEELVGAIEQAGFRVTDRSAAS